MPESVQLVFEHAPSLLSQTGLISLFVFSVILLFNWNVSAGHVPTLVPAFGRSDFTNNRFALALLTAIAISLALSFSNEMTAIAFETDVLFAPISSVSLKGFGFFVALGFLIWGLSPRSGVRGQRLQIVLKVIALIASGAIIYNLFDNPVEKLFSEFEAQPIAQIFFAGFIALALVLAKRFKPFVSAIFVFSVISMPVLVTGVMATSNYIVEFIGGLGGAWIEAAVLLALFFATIFGFIFLRLRSGIPALFGVVLFASACALCAWPANEDTLIGGAKYVSMAVVFAGLYSWLILSTGMILAVGLERLKDRAAYARLPFVVIISAVLLSTVIGALLATEETAGELAVTIRIGLIWPLTLGLGYWLVSSLTTQFARQSMDQIELSGPVGRAGWRIARFVIPFFIGLGVFILVPCMQIVLLHFFDVVSPGQDLFSIDAYLMALTGKDASGLLLAHCLVFLPALINLIVSLRPGTKPVSSRTSGELVRDSLRDFAIGLVPVLLFVLALNRGLWPYGPATLNLSFLSHIHVLPAAIVADLLGAI